MYNRYVPQADGSFRRSAVETGKPPCPPPPKPPKQPPQAPDSACQCPPPPPKHPPQEHPPEPPTHGSVSGFLRRLLPPDFDTGDLIVVLLLLLLAGDREEDRSTAMLTLVLYLFL